MKNTTRIDDTITAYPEGDGLLIGRGESRDEIQVSCAWIRSDTTVPIHE